jgi:acyl-CoA thioesterase
LSLRADSAVEAIGGGRYRAEISRDWSGPRAPHGGYLAALMLRAVIAETADPARPPRSFTIHFPAAPAPGPCEVHVTRERVGRSLMTLSARLVQGERACALALAACSPSWPGTDVDELRPPPSPPADVRPPIAFAPGKVPDFWRHIDGIPTLGREPSADGRVEAGGWIRSRHIEELDAPAAAFLLDAWWPPMFSRLDEPRPLPTIDLTIHFRRPLPDPEMPPGEYALAAFRTGLSHDGFFEEDGELWSHDGRLLAQSRQLALLLPPSGAARASA